MKVIDLLNKIANGEELPKEIKIYMGEGKVAPFTLQNKEHLNRYTGQSLIECLNEFNLNDEVEIIGEDIEKLDRVSGSDLLDLQSNSSLIEQNKAVTNLIMYLNMNVVKINELVSAVNKLKNKE